MEKKPKLYQHNMKKFC